MCVGHRTATNARPLILAGNGRVGFLWSPAAPRGSQRYDMPNFAKPIVLGTALLVGITMGTNADPLPRTGDKSADPGAAVPSGAHRLPGNEVAALPPSDATPRRDSIVLPGVSVIAPFYSHPYTSGIGAKASPNG